MWPFTRKSPRVQSPSTATGTPQTRHGLFRTRVRVIGIVEHGAIRVIVGPGDGMLDGGSEQSWPIDDVPSDLRFPNTEFFLTHDTVDLRGKPRIERIEDVC